MKKTLTIAILLLALTACTPRQAQVVAPGATGTPPPNMPNPASVYCTQQGNRLEIRTAADGSQTGICVFTDGSTCDEWAFFRGECGPVVRPTETPLAVVATATPAVVVVQKATATPAAAGDRVDAWWGVIVSFGAGAQFDDYFQRRDLGQVVNYGIDARDPAVQAQIVALRDTGRVVVLYGTLLSDVPDAYGSQVQVERIEEQGSGGSKPPETAEAFADWWGVIVSAPPGAQFDDSFERRDLGQVIVFGIDSLDPAVRAQIVAQRDSGRIVHLWGTLLSNVPDVNGSQVQVERIEVE
jgi:putative hemolysin